MTSLRRTHRSLVAAALWSVVLASACTGDTRNSKIDLSCAGCNVIMLNIELLRPDYVGLLSPGKDTTPNIDAFFKDAIVFEQVSAPAGETYRSNLAVLTAMDPRLYETSAVELASSDPETRAAVKRELTRYSSAAEVFAQAGYHTVGINQGVRSGTATFLERGFIDFVEFPGKVTPFEDSLAALAPRLRQIKAPSLLLYHPTVLHPGPYRYPLSRPRADLEGRVRYVPKQGQPYYAIRIDKELPGEVRRQTEHAIYEQQVKYMDDALSDVFRLINERKLYENSIIILYSNHGTGLGDNGVFEQHGVSYQSCIHVPLLIRHPKVHRTVRIRTPITLLDLVPTIYDMVGIQPPKGISGQTLEPLIHGSDYGRRQLIGRNDYDQYIRSGDWKLVIGSGKRKELYNLAKDPGETNNMIDQHPEIAKQLEAVLIRDTITLKEQKRGRRD